MQWDQGKGVWESLIGGTSYSKLTSFIVTGLTPGKWYQFRYRAKNDFGWGLYSDPVSVQAATMPDKISQVATTVVGTSIRMNWLKPEIRGDEVAYYTVLIKSKTGDFIEDTVNCDGRDVFIREQRYCDVPISALMSNPYDLLQGDQVLITVTATNTYGTSVASDVNSLTVALIQVVPHKPPTIPRKGWNTNENVIEIFYDALTGELTGGSAILSYVILWDAGSGDGNFVVLKGVSTPNLSLTVLIDQGISSGTFYTF